MAEVRLTSRRDSEFYNALPKPDEVSLPQSFENINPDQVCKTCINQRNRAWDASTVEQMVHIRNGGKLEDLFCQPNKPWGSYRVLNKTDWRGRIVPLDSESDTPTRAVVESCGQQIRQDCAKCDRFNAIQVRVAYTSSPDAKVAFTTVEHEGGAKETVPYVTDGSAVKYWNVTVGGSCGIPVGGITVKGSITHCDFQPRKKRIESPSCANCYYLDNKDESTQFHHLEVNDNARLTPYEREQIPADEYGLALWRKQTQPQGRRYWFAGTILKSADRNGIMIYKIRFDKSHAVGIISSDNDDMRVHPLANDRVAVDILYPYNKLFRLKMPLHKRNRIWPSLPEKVRVTDDCTDLVNPVCSDCRPNKACYFHAKKPVVAVDGTIEFDNPKGKTALWEYPPHGLLHVTEHGGRVAALDGNNNLPQAYSDTVANASVFRMWLPTLLEKAYYKYGQRGRTELYAQYLGVMNGLAVGSKDVPYRPGWLRNSTIEPGKSYCSHPEGPDLRKVFQDSFGSERVDWEFDHGSMTHDQVEEEWRVGFRQHTQTPQHLQEEILATDASHPNYDPASGAIRSVPVEINVTKVTKIEAIGDMYHDDGTPVTDVHEFIDALSTEVTIGTSGASDRNISKRQQLFGYDLTRGYYGKRRGSEKTSMPAADPTFVVFELEDKDPEQMDITDAWTCPECYHNYDNSEIEDLFDPTCPDCGSSMYKNHMVRTTHNPRAGGGIGNAFVMDNSRMQERKRLYSTLCPKWRLKANTIITLDDVHGASGSTPAGAMAATKDEAVNKITVGKLTDEQRASNDEYNQRKDAVIAQRTAHMDKYPDTKSEELVKLYPTPRGTWYEQKAEGSLSKMGGV